MDVLRTFGAFRFAFVVGLVVAATCGYILVTHFLAQPSKTLLFSVTNAFSILIIV